MEDYTPKKSFSTTINNSASPVLYPEESLYGILDEFEIISLAEMDSVRLMSRIDTKYLLNRHQLPQLLIKAREHYKILEINNKRVAAYSTVYWDTDLSEMYIMHHNRKLNRYKIRMRSYLDSDISFLEIKQKNNKGITSKRRIEIDNSRFYNWLLNEREEQFLAEISPYCFDALRPSLQNSFQRITLVDKEETERITIDLDLTYKGIDSSHIHKMEDLVIIEMKQGVGSTHSFFYNYLRDMSIQPVNMSKYCMGMTLIYPALKSNRFKKKLRLINKITNNTNYASN